MEFRHVPVLYDQAIDALAIKEGGIYVDGTVGGGGHSRGICEKIGDTGTLIAVDRDKDALEAAEQALAGYGCKIRFLHASYSDVDAIATCAGNKVDGILLDLGVSSFQLDAADRGFSYMHDGPIDMRMNADQPLTASDVVNGYSRQDLARIIRDYGEERWAYRIAEFIVKARDEEEIDTTGRLVETIKAAIPAAARRDGPHPAKRTFQAIRIEVNGELEHLEKACRELPDLLASGGRLAIITFHSLEDRIVKESFAKRLDPCICPKELPVCVCGRVADVRKITGKPIVPDDKETEYNPRARSAKLRVIEKI